MWLRADGLRGQASAPGRVVRRKIDPFPWRRAGPSSAAVGRSADTRGFDVPLRFADRDVGSYMREKYTILILKVSKYAEKTE
jgi:hypothetical protein